MDEYFIQIISFIKRQMVTVKRINSSLK